MKPLPSPLALNDVYAALYEAWGPQGWWPAESDFEMCVGAILVQQTSWRNVERAIENLKNANLLGPEAMMAADSSILEAALRPSGFFRVKATRLRAFSDLVCTEFGGKLDEMLRLEAGILRELLLSVNGVGKETADCILLYAARVPQFVVDEYTRRVLVRHGWLEENVDYDEVAGLFTRHLDGNVKLYQEFHALLVELGKQHCKKVAECKHCPLQRWLPSR